MKSLMKTGFMSVVLLLSFIVFAAEGDVAKVIILKGSVKVKLKDNTVKTLKKGDWVPEGAQVKTEAKSFVKLLFIDKSQMNLGPNSQMIINKFPKKKAGIITLMKGSLRSKVSKDYMQMDKTGEKLYIKTKTAAMGVRGTDFEVGFIDGVTTTNLYEGSLVITSFEGNGSPPDMEKLFRDQAKLIPISAGQMAIFKGPSSMPSVLKIPDNVMKEAVKSGGKGGNLKTLSNSNIKVGGNNLLLPGTKKEDVANSSAGEASTVAGSESTKGPVVKDEKGATDVGPGSPGMVFAAPPKDGQKEVGIGPGSSSMAFGAPPKDGQKEDGRGPASEGGPTDRAKDKDGEDCPLSGCGGVTGVKGPRDIKMNEFSIDGPKLEDPCVNDPGLCEVAPLDGDICVLNPQLPQCGGGSESSTNVQFNFSTE
jgi:hypothetical protein